MKTCSLCGSTYDDKVDFCFQDGTPLRKVDAGPTSAPAPVEAPLPPRPRHDTLGGLDAPDPLSALDAPEATPSSAASLDPTGLPEPKGPPPDDDEPFSQVPDDDEPVVSGAEELGLTAPLPGGPEPLPDVDETGAELEDEPGLTAPLPVTPATTPVVDDSAHKAPEPVDDDAAPFESEDDDFSFGDSTVPASSGDDDYIPYATQLQQKSKMPIVLGVLALLLVGGAGAAAFLGGEGDPEPTEEPETTVAAPTPKPEPVRQPPPPPEPEPEPEAVEEATADEDAVADAAAAQAEAEAEAAREEAARRAADERRAAQQARIAAARQGSGSNNAGTSSAETNNAGSGSSQEQLWEAPAAASEGKLNVTSTPAGATVYVDGTAVGTTPTSATVAYGNHTVKLSLDGYESTTRTVDVKTGSLSVPFQLKSTATTGRVNLFGTTGSVVYDGSTKLGTIPVTAQLSEGTHTFKVVLPDGSSYSVTRNVQFPDGGRPVNIPLSPN